MHFFRFPIIPSLMICMLLILPGCKQSGPGQTVYYGKGEEWLATFSIFKVNHSLFDSIYIQNISENREEKTGPIEYQLIGGEGFTVESQYPQELQGVRSFHTSSEMNGDVIGIQPNEDGAYKLTIKWDGKVENLSLRAITGK